MVLFIGSLLFFTLTVRLVPVINDTLTPLNVMVAISEGHLHLNELVYGPESGSPGMYIWENRLYGRNYGQAMLTMPFYWLISALAMVAELRVVLVAVWTLGVVAFFDQLGAVVDRRPTLATAGSVIALGLLGVNLQFATPLDHLTIPLIALQASTMVAAGFVGVITYRLGQEMYNRRIGIGASVAIVLASPVGFWAIFPKRHSWTVLAAMLVLFSVYRSRDSEDPNRALAFRALAYVWVATYAWVKPSEAFMLFVGLGFVDLVTARSNGLRKLLFVGGVFLIAALPFLATNFLISGNPVRPTRFLQHVPGTTALLDANGRVIIGGSSSSGTGGSPATDGSAGTLGYILLTFIDHITGAVTSQLDPGKYWRVFGRSGYIEGVDLRGRNIAMRLSVLESMPVMAAFVALPLVLYRKYTAVQPITPTALLRSLRRRPAYAVDLLALVYAVLFILIYWPRVPVHASFTVRYLHVLYPLGMYGLIRLAAVRQVVDTQYRLLIWSYVSFVLIGGQLLIVVVALVPRTIGEAVQLHALLLLGAAGLVALWAILTTQRDGYERFGAVSLALAAAMTTLFLLLSGLIYFSYTSNYALPMSRVLSDALTMLDTVADTAGNL